MTTLTKVLAGAVLVLLAACGVLWWQVQRHKNDAAEAAVAPAKEASAAAKAKVETVTVVLAGKRDTLLRVLHDTIPVPESVLHPVTPADTASAVAALPIVKAERDSIARSCSAFMLSCDEYRARAEQRFHADSTVIAKQDALLKIRPPRRHWTFGIGPGYGLLYDRLTHRIVDGPTLTATLTWSPF